MYDVSDVIDSAPHHIPETPDDFLDDADDFRGDPDDVEMRFGWVKKSGRHFFRDLDGHDRHDRTGQMSSPKSKKGQNGL